MIFSTETLEHVYQETGDIRLIADIVQARVCLSNTKAKVRNMIKTHPKYESFYDRVAKKHSIKTKDIELCIALEQVEMSLDLQAIGGIDPKKQWDAFFTLVRTT